MYIIPETELVSISEIRGDERKKTFVLEPLLPGYGVTVANALRRVLLSSLEGCAVTSVVIEGASHEFATLPSVREDVLDIILNLKSLRVKVFSDEPATVTLDVKGPAEVKAKDFSRNPDVEFVDPNAHIATVEKGGKLKLTATLEKGRGFLPTESREKGKEALGTIQLDAAFSPVKKVSFNIENTRVGRMTNFDKVTLEIETDGTVDPAYALAQACSILVEHLGRIGQFARGETIKMEETLVPAAKTERKPTRDKIVKRAVKAKTTKVKRGAKKPRK
jgi:DNA-directed RNA polymerase subunit alpha